MHLIAPVNITAEATGFSRNSLAWYWDRLGVLQSAAVHTLRVTYDPADLKAAPYPLLETNATNFIRNNTMVGAAVGTPGTLPTNWTVLPAPGCSRQVVEIGVEDGVNYIDLRIFGTCNAPDAGLSIQPDSSYTSAALGQVLAASSFVRLVGGSLSGLSLKMTISERDASNSVLAVGEAGFTPSDAALKLQRKSYVRTLDNASTAAARMAIVSDVENGATIDFTLRIGLPQLERTDVTSVIKTTGSASVNRAAETLPAGNGLIYSNLTENDTDDAPLWVSGQAVAKDLYRRRAETHKVYRALQAVPTSVTAAPETDPKDTNGAPYWLEWEPTNRWAAFDTTLDTASTSSTEIAQWVVRPGEITGALAVLAADAADLRVSMVSASGRVIYRKTKSMLLQTSRSWSDWFFKTRERRTDEAFLGMPFVKNALICITATKPGSTPKVGDIKMGRLEDIGETLVEPEVRTLRNSIIARDAYGRPRFTKRPSNKIMSANVYIPAARFDAVARMVNKYTDEPCVIIGDETWTSLILLGYVDDFALVLQDRNNANYNLKAIGLG